MAKNKPPIVAT